MLEGFLDFAETATVSLREKDYERFGFADAEPYFEERIRISYRTLRRYLSLVEGLERVKALGGQKDATQCRQQLVDLGVHKASVLAPVLGRLDLVWSAWMERAQAMSEAALQEAVSVALGHQARGSLGLPGEMFLSSLLTRIPPERREQVEWVFREMGKFGDPSNPWNAVAVFLQLVNFGETDLAAHGIYRKETS